ncbi:hypothetical protein C8Q79DRAFT_1006425 [Trametes meyenii]|nr:hypothetical protein C8Q79DRAFT_1006425 [Trametes meyenii]
MASKSGNFLDLNPHLVAVVSTPVAFGLRYTPLLVLALLVSVVHCVVPAFPSNVSITPGSGQYAVLFVTWGPGQLFKTDAERVLVKEQSLGASHGALVHFTDSLATAATVGTSRSNWIALVQCDWNETNASPENIFSRAQQLGATAGLLYTLYSEACYIDQSLEDLSQFNPRLDIYTVSRKDSLILNSTFSNIDATQYGSFDAAKLDADFQEIVLGEPQAETKYLISTIQMDNVGPGSSSTSAGGTGSSASGTATSTTASITADSDGATITSGSAAEKTGTNSGMRISPMYSSIVSGLFYFGVHVMVGF